MNVRTIEDNFDYQMHSIFEAMQYDYKEAQKYNQSIGSPVKTFAEWLWDNREDLGAKVYEAFDEYTGIDDETEKYNFNP